MYRKKWLNDTDDEAAAMPDVAGQRVFSRHSRTPRHALELATHAPLLRWTCATLYAARDHSRFSGASNTAATMYYSRHFTMGR